ncbi:MAG: hypothetical protein VX278_22465 [Myxococcota bacterium]|nr:hypothetical protein [Myxococcota bacterium]
MFLLFSHVSFAGMDIPEHLRKQYLEECKNQTSGKACVELANETLCGRGFNTEYASFMTKACAVFQKNCDKGNAQACTEHAFCILDCSPVDEEAYVSTTMNALGLRHCFFPSKEENADKGIDVLQKSCLSGDINGCLNAATILEHGEYSDIGKRQTVLRKACEMNHPSSCADLSESLRQESEQARDKACTLGESQLCTPAK